ncbi:hypothetical protein LOC68_07645 [Blastopirellula sp. JC732]|uniref:F-box/LRR-repeat protein 15-like leucin rich repeat domain-containing protein n=1 Tax=Blastopirellula sediminis TaxID=2894196 RepID=A0A9X1MML6_9BACT|nr:hypothetical protein [Blastopirellula sediminis]MCC9608959.1 hypothetical protein [Blastopirellula sediminis]MCC9628264.1 hypothetical protein [Blastopirellula sediminis]
MRRTLKESIERLGGYVEIGNCGSILGIGLRGKEIDEEALALLRDADAREVQYLSLAESGVTDASLDILGFLPKLENLDLFNTGITGTGFDRDKTASLKKLNLVACREISVAGVSRLATIKSIERLKLSDSSIDDDGLGVVATLPNLKMLWLDDTNITDAGLAALSSANELAFLSVDGTNVTSEGFNRLYQTLPSLRRSLIM